MKNEPVRHCYICDQYKPESEFYRDPSRVCKVASKCKECNKIHYRARRKQAKRNRAVALLRGQF